MKKKREVMSKELYCLKENLGIISKSDHSQKVSEFYLSSQKTLLPRFIVKIIKKTYGRYISREKIIHFSKSFFKDENFLFDFFDRTIPYIIYPIKKRIPHLQFIGEANRLFPTPELDCHVIETIKLITNTHDKDLNLKIINNKNEYKKTVILPKKSVIAIDNDFDILGNGFKEESLNLSNFHSLKYFEISKLIKNSSGKNIFDFGCGDGSFISYCKSLNPTFIFWGYDQRYTKDSIEKAGGNFISDPSHFKEKVDILTLIEVIEHIPYENHLETTTKIKMLDPTEIIISTPTASPHGFTHSDHKFEWTKHEFKSWVKNYFPEYKKEKYISLKHPLQDREAQIIKLKKSEIL